MVRIISGCDSCLGPDPGLDALLAVEGECGEEAEAGEQEERDPAGPARSTARPRQPPTPGQQGGTILLVIIEYSPLQKLKYGDINLSSTLNLFGLRLRVQITFISLFF